MSNTSDSRDHPAWDDLHINDAGRTIKASVRAWLTDDRRRQPGVLTVLAGYVSIRGLLLLTPTLGALVRNGVRLRLLFGVAPGESAWVALPATDGYFTDETVDEAALPRLLDTAEQLIRVEIDRVPATKADSLALLELLELLRHELVAVRRYERRFMHAKAVVFQPERGASTVLAGSANLSLGGMRHNQELQTELPPRLATQAATLVEHWWCEAVDYDLAALIERRFLAWPHELVYLRMLQEVYGQDVAAKTQLQLHDYQKDGVARAIAVILRLGGVLIGDDVGLGKTYQAAELIRYARDAGWGATLVVCPASLRRMWQTKLAMLGISANVVSYHQLRDAVDGQTADSQWASYGMVICDEAHILRNPATSFMTAVRSVLRHQDRRPYVVLMTATPVNNHGRDLYELLALADANLEPGWVPGQAHTSDRESTRSRYAADLLQWCERPNLLDPPVLEQLHDELDQRMVRRTREFINTRYPDADLKFPKQMHEEVTYRLSDPMRRLLGDVLDALGADDGQLPPELRKELCDLRGERPRFAPLTLAAYEVSAYANGTSGICPQALAGLLRILLCKRVESSPAAFAATASQLRDHTRKVLDDLKRGIVRAPNRRARTIATRNLENAIVFADADSDIDLARIDDMHDEPEESEREGVVPVDPATLDVERLTAGLTADLKTLTQLAARAHEAAKFDTKRDRLLQLLHETANHRSGPKVVLFASARVTTTSLEHWLTGDAAPRTPAEYHHTRIANVGGPERLSDKDVARTVARFAPKTAADLLTGGLSTPPPDTYNLLIGTDMLAEGFNLQQAGIIINYDLPWNPQILGQRAGRIDRLASLHDVAMCYTFVPDTGVDLILNLMGRLIGKAEIAAAAVGVPNPLFAGSPVAVRTFGTTTWTSEVGPGVTLRHFIADEHRATLANALRIDTVAAALGAMPAGAGAVVQATTTDVGTVFCLDKNTLPPDWPHGALGHVLGGSKAGAIIRDTMRCLTAAQVPLDDWLRRARDGEDPSRNLQPLPETNLVTMFKRLPHLDITDQSDKPIRPITWINFEEKRRSP